MPARLRIVLLSMFAMLFCACLKQVTIPENWKTWIQPDSAVFRGQYPLVGDPSVITDGGIFMTLVNEPQVIGVAKSSTPFGPWDVNEKPVVRPDKSFSTTAAVAPWVLIENNRVRRWYHGFSANRIQIGYAKGPWPMKD